LGGDGEDLDRVIVLKLGMARLSLLDRVAESRKKTLKEMKKLFDSCEK
jgi:hypothetical protein